MLVVTRDVVVAGLEQAGLAVMQAHSALAEFSTAIAVKPQAPTTQPAPAASIAGNLEHWQAMSVDEQLTKEAAEKRQDVCSDQQPMFQQDAGNLTPHEGIADCCAAQGVPVIQLGGDVIVPGDVLTVVLGTERGVDEDVKVELEL